MIIYILTSPMTWISISIVSLCVVCLDLTLRPIWEEFIAECRVSFTIIPALPDNVDLPGDTVVDGRPGGIREGNLEV